MEADQNELKDQPEIEPETSHEHETEVSPEVLPEEKMVEEPSDDPAEFTPEADSGEVKQNRKAQKKSEKAVFSINFYSWATPIVGVAMLIIGLLAGYFGRPLLAGTQETPDSGGSASVDSTPVVSDLQPPANNASAEEVMAFLTGNVRHFRGDENAPVTIIEFSDFQWPYCARFATDAGRQIDEQYVSNGDVRFGYWHVAFLGPESQTSAEAAECAGEQGAFWEYHDILFENHSGENQGAFNDENLKRFAEELGLDTEAFNECLDSGRYTETVQADTNLARQIGANSTPAFLINGQPILGAQPFEVFQQMIDQLLQAGS